MPRWLTVLVLAGAILVPSPALGQAPIALSNLEVQLWPEYDQPSMLVIYDFQLADGAPLPVGISVKFPKAANLIAVAMQDADGDLLDADYLESSGDDTWQSVIVQVQTPAVYRIEYYQPLARSGDQRQYLFQWAGQYPVEALGISVRMPTDVSGVSADPQLQSAQNEAGTQFLVGDFGPLEAGKEFTLHLRYSRTSESLAASQEDLGPSRPLDASTPGRVMLSKYLPWILGTLGFVLIAGGSLYFWQSSRAGTRREKRHPGKVHGTAQPAGDVYCHQCGARAEPSDRFCRVCGTRLRLPE